jgi:hypothetical protein
MRLLFPVRYLKFHVRWRLIKLSGRWYACEIEEMILHDSHVHTCRIAKPVGRKASRLWKMSPTVRWRVVNRITRVITDPIKRNSLRSLNMSWKSALNFFLPMETICGSKALELVNCIPHDKFIFKKDLRF